MISGSPDEARWVRAEPRRCVQRPLLERLIESAIGRRQISAIHPLTDGFRNANFKVEFTDESEPIVVRLYEHDPSLCLKEIDLMRLVSALVPVPEIIYAEPRGWDVFPALLVMRFIEGVSLRDLRHMGDRDALAEVGYSLGQTLASIGQFSFEKQGWISGGLTVTSPLLDGSDPVPRFIDLCLASKNVQQRVPPELVDSVHKMVWAWAPQLASLGSETRLVHSDLGHRNLLVRPVDGRWRVTAVLDWEFAVSYSPLADIGHLLLRHERRSMDVIEPAFIKGYTDNGGSLPKEWRRLARLVDLTAVCESLTHDRLPEGAIKELTGFIQATLL